MGTKPYVTPSLLLASHKNRTFHLKNQEFIKLYHAVQKTDKKSKQSTYQAYIF